MHRRTAAPAADTSTTTRLGKAALFCVGCALGAVIAVVITVRLVRPISGSMTIPGSDGESRFGVGLYEGKYVGLELMDSVGKSQRASMDVLPDGTVQIVLCDPAGARRLRLAVDGEGTPSIQSFDKDGKAAWKVP